MKVADYIAKFITNEGVDTVFGYQGGAIAHIVNSLYETEGVRFVSVYHEQGAAFAAEGYSRASENVGVAVATSGPGATNLITGIGSCFYDSIACVFITGQVNTYEFRRNSSIRQEGFQETDIVEIVKSITKYSVMIKKAEDIRYCLEKAFYLAKNGRKGPVLLDIPMNIQREEIDENALRGYSPNEEESSEKKKDISKEIIAITELIEKAKRPLLLLGGGVRNAKVINEVEELVKLTKIPVVTTLMGLDSIGVEYENFVGYMGTYGGRAANLAVANCDLLLVLGSRLTTRQTSTKAGTFAREAKIIHVDIDKNELNIKVKEDLSINCHLKDFLGCLLKEINEKDMTLNYDLWIEKVKEYKKQYPTFPTQKNEYGIDPNETMNKISKYSTKNTIFTLDVGQNQIWAAQSLEIKAGQRVLNSGGMGAMGFSLPCAIGAYYAKKASKIICIVGDGGFQINIQELQTIVRENIPIKIILMNNKSLGMIRHFQELYFDEKYYGTVEGYDTPDFIKVCTAYGIDSFKVNSSDDLIHIKSMIEDDKSHFIEIDLGKITYVIPKLEMGRPIEDQWPLVDREAFKKNMIVKPLQIMD